MKSIKTLIILLLASSKVFGQNVPDQIYVNGVPTGISTDIPGNVTNTMTLPSAYNANGNIAPTLFNYVRTFVPNIPIANTSSVTKTSSASTVSMQTSYSNGFGAPLLEIARYGANAQDIVKPYDNRPQVRQFDFLPYPTSGSSNFKLSPFLEQQSYYLGLYPNEVGISYSETKPVTNSVERGSATYAPGKSNGGQRRGSETLITKNGSDEVINWTPSATSFTNSGYYAVGTLIKKTTQNSDGRYFEEYYDRDNKLIKRVVIGSSIACPPNTIPGPVSSIIVGIPPPVSQCPVFETSYYVYDDFDRLRFVISPKAYKKLEENNLTQTLSIRNNLCDRFDYDGMGRLISQHQMGQDGDKYIVYDRKNRAVLIQSPELAYQGKWEFTLYDRFDRPTVRGFLTSSSTRSQWQAILDDPSSVILPISNTPYIHTYIAFLNDDSPYPDAINDCEILSYTFYDNYDKLDDVVLPAVSLPYSTSVLTGNLSTATSAVQPVQSDRTKGFVTGVFNKVIKPTSTNSTVTTKISALSDWVKSVNYYDDYGRLIQTRTLNQYGKTDDYAIQYDFTGNIIREITRQRNPFNINDQKVIVTKYEFETYSRKLSSVYQNIDATGWKPIANYTYDALGRLSNKSIGDIESQAHIYNIRGQLTGINAPYAENGSANDYISFGESIKYDNGFTSRIYCGEPAGLIWRGPQASNPRAYGYSYDRAGRLTHADFRELTVPAGTSGNKYWNKDDIDFTEGNIVYDQNGNIKELKRWGPITTGTDLIDHLQMVYGDNDVSNQIDKITDLSTVPTSLTDYDYHDQNNTTYEITYTKNGAFKKYNDKKVSGISYNLLDKQNLLTFVNGNKIYYVYDASGAKLQEIHEVGSVITTSDFVGSYEYTNGALDKIANAEGFVKPNGTSLDYYYFVRDHLGNVRNILKPIEVAYDLRYIAGLEVASAYTENLVFEYIDPVRDDRPDPEPSDTKAARLEASDPSRRIGTSLLIRVMAGDEYDLSADGYFTNLEVPAENPSSSQVLSSIISTLSSGVGGLEGGAEGNGAESVSRMFNAENYGIYDAIKNAPGITNPNAPKAYLNYILFDENYRIVREQSGAIQIGGVANAWQTLGSNVPVRIGRSGYMAVYISSEDATRRVYFDHISLRHTVGSLIEENHYYPFGLTVNLSNNGTVSNKDLYQTKRLDKTNNLTFYDFGARQYDPHIGRFMGVDPMEADWSPYIGMSNTPNVLVDPTGLKSENPEEPTNPDPGTGYYYSVGPNGPIYGIIKNPGLSGPPNMVDLGPGGMWFLLGTPASGLSGSNGISTAGKNDLQIVDMSLYNSFSVDGLKVSDLSANIGISNSAMYNNTLYRAEDIHAGPTSWVPPAGKVNVGISTLAGAVENTAGKSRVGYNLNRFNLNLYRPTQSGRVFTGNQYVKTYSATKLGKGLGLATIFIGTGLDAIGVGYYYRYGPNNPNAVSPPKASINLGIGLWGLLNLPTTIGSASYFLIDNFYPGGFQNAMDRAAEVDRAERHNTGHGIWTSPKQ